MASSLKRVVDYKLLYDSLADPSNGMIKLTTLTTRWPNSRDLASAISKLPRGLPGQWRSAADDSGYLDWERFSSALEKALEEDKPRLIRSEATQKSSRFEEDNSTSATRQQKSASLAPRVTVEEIEVFLSRCRGNVLAQALSRTRKEVYKCQMSLHQLESSSSAAAKGKVAKQQSDPSSTKGHVKVPLLNSLSTVGREKEELLKGKEVMEITRLWFNSRLEQLALEEKQPTKKLKPEELLAALERRDDQPESETIKHIQEINSHLGQLAKEAPGLSLEQAKKHYQQQQKQKQKARIKNVASDPGPFSRYTNKTLVSSQGGGGVGGGASVRATPKVQMNFPAYSPANRTHAGPSSSRPSPARSSSMREVHTIRGEAEADATGQRSTHHSVSMSTQNLSNHHRQDNQSHHHPQHHERPKRSHSFNEHSTISGYGSGGSGVSSTATTSSGGSHTTDYPRNSAHSYAHINQYPLRGSSSLQTLPSSGSYNAVPSSNLQKHSSHHNTQHSSGGGYQGQRSSSVRNIPSASTGFAMATTTASATSSVGSGRPIISQPTSATARVESVDIPTQPPAMAAMKDPSSSYPGHGQRMSSGHTHGVTRGENPKPSRRHLHKAVQEQSLRIRQLEAENVNLTRDRGHRGQQKTAPPPSSSTGHPMIKTSALQSVV